jgi:hypothetical protein
MSDPNHEELLRRFDEAWRRGASPQIDDYLRGLATGDAHVRQKVLEELFRIDLEYRWRNGSHTAARGASAEARVPRLEDYVKRYPGLGSSLELIGYEYRVRQRRRWLAGGQATPVSVASLVNDTDVINPWLPMAMRRGY